MSTDTGTPAQVAADVGDARLFLDGRWEDGAATSEVVNPWTGATLAVLHEADRGQVARATRAVAAAQTTEVLRPPDRYRVLARAAELVGERRVELTRVIVAESGFTIADATTEISRAAETLLLSAEEAKRIHGEMVPIDAAPGAGRRIGFTVRHPIGVVAAITPFNSPLNTVAHKVGPALAAGNGVILKPATATPLTAQHLVQILLDAGLPEGHVALVHGPGGTTGTWLLEDPQPDFYAFTGSTEVGLRIRRTVGLRRTQLELGSLSSTIVCEDADLDWAVPRCVNAAFRKAGQVCTSVQRLYVHARVLDDFVGRVRDQLAGRLTGDPADPETFIGPLISVSEADRVQRWVEGAVDRGAEVLAGGKRTGGAIEPTVLLGVTPDTEVMCKEIFGPVVAVRPYDSLDAAIDEANATPYGLATGIFTADLNRALTAAQRLRMGSVHVNETSSSRVDLMPYGGVKASGLGREGPKYATAEMTEERLITISQT